AFEPYFIALFEFYRTAIVFYRFKGRIWWEAGKFLPLRCVGGRLGQQPVAAMQHFEVKPI
ncbi:hypothetical protein, partial [Paramuribaculum intestinale]